MVTTPKIEEDTDVDVNLDLLFDAHLVVYNDDVNTFDWVIRCFVDVCEHSVQQAEQLSLLIHYKGKACAKTDKFDILKPMKDALVERGLSAVIETVDA